MLWHGKDFRGFLNKASQVLFNKTGTIFNSTNVQGVLEEVSSKLSWQKISCNQTEVTTSATPITLNDSLPADYSLWCTEFSFGGVTYTSIPMKKGDASTLINSFGNSQYHVYAYMNLTSSNTIQGIYTSKGSSVSSIPLYITGVYYKVS